MIISLTTVSNFIIRIWVYALTWQTLTPCIDHKGGGGVQTPRKTMQYLVNYCKIGLCLTPLANHSLTPPPPLDPREAVDNCYMVSVAFKVKYQGLCNVAPLTVKCWLRQYAQNVYWSIPSKYSSYMSTYR